MQPNIISDITQLIHESKIGFEKESIRVSDLKISQAPHPRSLGSALCNRFITTDFSEAQLEMVTPPFRRVEHTIEFLDDIHHFVSNNIADEVIWPTSFPVSMIDESEIPIANYGNSNLAKFKRLYRNGLSHRYGRLMQSISGFHFNYSVSERIWDEGILNEKGEDLISIRSSLYFNMIRNIYRYNWLIYYLFGASPILTSNFLKTSSAHFKKLDSETFYLPYATSLRMSHFGYQNTVRKKIGISLDSVEEYTSSLKAATSTPCEEFQNIVGKSDKYEIQINENLLQIDDEFYAVARAKSRDTSNQSTSFKLSKSGVDFIELRSLDLNPFNRVGIDQQTAFFLETFMAFCFLEQNEVLSPREIGHIDHNDTLVAENGRKPNLKLHKNNKTVSLRSWGDEIMDELFLIASLLDDDDKRYTNAVSEMKKRIFDSSLTLSERFLDEIRNQNISYPDFVKSLAVSNKDYYLNKKKSDNKNWHLLEEEAMKSDKIKESMDSNLEESFEEYMDKIIR